MKSPSIILTIHEDRSPTVDGLSTPEAEFALPTEDKEVEVLERMVLDTEADQCFRIKPASQEWQLFARTSMVTST